MHRLSPRLKFLPPLILVGSLFVIYLSTMAPGLTWAHDGSDGGDLIGAAATGGIPHPTGYPLYLILARSFQYLPVGNVAFRTNVFSACATILAAGLVYWLVVSSSAVPQGTYLWPAGLAAGYAFGLAPLIWSQAVITEVYGLQAMLTVLILSLYTRTVPLSSSTKKRLDYWRGLVLGLAMGNHISTILLLPAALALGSLDDLAQPQGPPRLQRFWFSNIKLNPGSLARQLGMLGLGLSVYLLIPLRAMVNPPVNWGNAVTPARFWWLVSGELYQSYYLQINLTEIWQRIQAAAAILQQQFGLPGLVLGLIGLFVFGKRSRLFFLTVWTASVFTVFAIVYGSPDSYVYLMPLVLCFAIWIGHGVIGLTNQFGRGSALLSLSLSALLIGFLATQAIAHASELDASTDIRAEAFGRQVLSTAPKNAVLFAKGDRAVFALWYFHFALGERPDLFVLAEDLLHFDWYQENLRATYPSLVVPGPFPWPENIALENPSRTICYVQYADQTEMECSQPIDPPAEH